MVVACCARPMGEEGDDMTKVEVGACSRGGTMDNRGCGVAGVTAVLSVGGGSRQHGEWATWCLVGQEEGGGEAMGVGCGRRVHGE